MTLIIVPFVAKWIFVFAIVLAATFFAAAIYLIRHDKKFIEESKNHPYNL